MRYGNEYVAAKNPKDSSFSLNHKHTVDFFVVKVICEQRAIHKAAFERQLKIHFIRTDES
jgi:hypothetical protein